MIGIIYTGESEEELEKETSKLDSRGIDYKIFVEHEFLEDVFKRVTNICSKLFDDRDMIAMYQGVDITNSKLEFGKRELMAEKFVTLQEIADKFGIPVEKLRIKK